MFSQAFGRCGDLESAFGILDEMRENKHLVSEMNEWMNEKYILLSFTTFVNENNDCHVVF